MLSRSSLPATLKQEMVITLLEVLATHSYADLALQLPAAPPFIHPPPAPPPAASKSEGGAAAASAKPGTDDAAAAKETKGKKKKYNNPLAALFGGVKEVDDKEDAAADDSDSDDEKGKAEANGDVPITAAAAVAAGLPTPEARFKGVGKEGEEAQAAAAAPPPPPPPPKQWTKEDLAAQPVIAEIQAKAVLWVGAAVTALQMTKACLQWEPLIPPPMPGQPPTPPLPPLQSVNLTTVPVDKWLQVLQGTCHAVRAVMRVHGHDELRSIYRANGGRMLQELSPWDGGGWLAKGLEGSAVSLQQVLQGVLTQWRGLSFAVRPRLLWVVAHYLELPNMLEVSQCWGYLGDSIVTWEPWQCTVERLVLLAWACSGIHAYLGGCKLCFKSVSYARGMPAHVHLHLARMKGYSSLCLSFDVLFGKFYLAILKWFTCL